jgi:hypothetical protein
MGQSRGGEDVAGHPVASVLQTPAFFVVCQGHLSWGSKGDGHDAGLHGRWRFHLAFSWLVSSFIGACLPDFTPYMQINSSVHQKARAYMGPEQQPYMGVFRAVPL